jgi:uracil DNA glycosylase
MNPVLTLRKTQRASVTRISWLMLLKGIIAVYCENHTKPIKLFRGQNAGVLNCKACLVCVPMVCKGLTQNRK